MDGLRPVSAARLLNLNRKIPYKVSNIDVGDFFNGFLLDLSEYVLKLTKETAVTAEERRVLEELFVLEAKKEYDPWQFTNGHDFYSALGASLRGDLGARRYAQTWGFEVEMHIRLAFTDADFKETHIFAALKSWEARTRYSVVSKRLH
ncbi:hypothetical protein [Mesorhizobium sp. L48C026A00]|uniref:hypothetical protein n=1 Tax=Mesorhizobium sp. L48C026A00 TaxID=1287182 RepID=UPI0003CFAF5A|nr:hypothetical protein [Mesorhizobium sp. L48C026A00]ESZ11564.1 hypothetical protein X737_29435 [Mesorhizobium sp. L48C026A00]